MLFEYNQYIQHVGYVCGARGMDYQEDPLPGSRESEKKVHCCSGKVIIINKGSQKITLILAEKCEVKNVNFQKYTSNRSQDTQKNLHSSSSDWALIIGR